LKVLRAFSPAGSRRHNRIGSRGLHHCPAMMHI
jgi:hypothetical protein